jgi:hypothetical protein
MTQHPKATVKIAGEQWENGIVGPVRNVTASAVGEDDQAIRKAIQIAAII